MRPNISAAAISRIISSNSNVKKASTRNIWSVGFIVTGYGPEVHVTYQDTDLGVVERNLDHIAELLNGREDRKYYAVKMQAENDHLFLKVEIFIGQSPEDEAADVEDMAAESEHAVTVAEVKAVLAGRWFEYTEAPQTAGAGYVVERLETPRAGLVRVSYKDHSHTSYALVTGGREAYALNAVERYTESFVQAGYSAWIDYEDTDGWSVLVGPAGHFAQQDKPEDVKEALTALREAVEADDLSFMTRKAGPTSIFVYFLVPFKDQLRRVEVSWSNGSYSSIGRFGGSRSEFHNTDLTVRFIRSEIAE
jgi:hypothetical protein